MKRLTRPWLALFVIVAVPSSGLLIAMATAPSLGPNSWLFLAAIAGLFGAIGIAAHVGERRKGRDIERVLSDGEMHVATIRELVQLFRGHPPRPSRFFQIWGEATPSGAIVSLNAKVPVAVAKHMAVGMTALVLVHDEVPFSLWIFPAGLPPALGAPASLTPHERNGAYR